MVNHSDRIVTVGAKRTLEYVIEALALLNRVGPEEAVVVRALGPSIAKAAEVAHILTKFAGVNADLAIPSWFTRSGVEVTCIDLPISRKATNDRATHGVSDLNLSDPVFLDFPLYNLLLDYLLSQYDKVTVSVQNTDNELKTPKEKESELNHILTIRPTKDGIYCVPGDDLGSTEIEEDDNNAVSRTMTTMSRCGLILSPRWELVSESIGAFDDVIMGLDTNILYDCVITQQLLDGFALTSPAAHIHTPNWLLLVVPGAVMHELEQAANHRDERGLLTRIGRMGYRALQEILEIDQSKDFVGVSLLIVGEANPVLDTRIELQGLRKEIQKLRIRTASGKSMTISAFMRQSIKLSTGDTIIRDQFKAFLRQINFHKGVYFLTSDKSNWALAETEGLKSIYYQKFPWRRNWPRWKKNGELHCPKLSFEEETLFINTPIGKLIYELAVEFGTLWIDWRPSHEGKTRGVKLECDRRGDVLEHWVNRCLKVKKRDARKLLNSYGGSADLNEVGKIWNELGGNMMGDEIFTSRSHAHRVK